ncbi:hypothetical protein [Nocardia nepalensis]|uniref:hypothetical protein n=1 Tax=Nocardia nepalensis TaxID=3375448 RepID=UPI003B677224
MRANCRNRPYISYRLRVRTGLAGMAAMALCISGAATAGVAHAADAAGELVSSIPQTPGWGGFDRVSALEYVTEGPTGATATATGLLFTPNGTPPQGGWPVIAWDHGTNSMSPQCGYQFHTYPTDHRGIVEASWPQLIPYLADLFA